MSDELRTPSHFQPAEGFEAFKFWILATLKDLGIAVKEISATLIVVQTGIAARNERTDIMQAELREMRQKLDDHTQRITELQVKAGLWGMVGGAVVGAVVTKLIK